MLSERLLRLRTIWAFQRGERGKEQNKMKVDSVKWELIIFEDEKRENLHSGDSVRAPGPPSNSGERQPDLKHLLMPLPNIRNPEFTHRAPQIPLKIQNNTQGSRCKLNIPLTREALGIVKQPPARLRLPQLKFWM